MDGIRIRMLASAADLIVAHGMAGVCTFYNSFVERKILRTIELFTFGMVITPIVRNENGRTVGHVTYWSNQRVTVSEPDGDNSLLLRVVEWEDKRPSLDECVKIWNGAI